MNNEVKKRTQEQQFEELERIAEVIPTPVYWVAPDGAICLGVNKYGLKTIGRSYNDFVGKSIRDLYPHEMAEKIVKHNIHVLQQADVLSQEETVVDAYGSIRHFMAIKSPLKDNTGNVVGLIGTSIEITREKNENRLRLEAEKEAAQLKIKNQEQLNGLDCSD